MKLAVSNIAWSDSEDADISDELKAAGADALEVAPGRLHPSPVAATASEAAEIRAIWQGRGLAIVSMQSLLFGRPDLTLFAEPEGRKAFVRYLGDMLRFAGALGAGPLVFGSPKNRLKDGLNFAEARDRAVPIFREIGDLAQAANTVFCLEANAKEYGCDFMTRLDEAAEVAAATAHPAIGLVVDTGNMELAGDRPERVAEYAELVRHLHLSRPQLAPLNPEDDFPRQVLNALREAGYDGIATVEMRMSATGARSAVVRAVEAARSWIDRT